jgi:hypothetical protein
MSNDEDRWKVGQGRAGSLSLINARITRAGNGRDGAILYYPGSGDDLLHPLFATYGTVKYFVFVDTQRALANRIGQAIRCDEKTALDPSSWADHLRDLSIGSTPESGWSFRFKRSERILLHFRMGSNEFLEANRQFRYDVFFEKDFWETSDTNNLATVLTRLKAMGSYVTNGSVGARAPFLEMCGLRHTTTVQLNGEQYVWQKVGPTPTDVAAVMRLFDVAAAAASRYLYVDPAVAVLNTDWTDNNWVDVLCVALVEARRAIAPAAERLSDFRVWDACESALLAAFSNDQSLYEGYARRAKLLAIQSWPNLGAVQARVNQLA